jgi:ribose/xylose/arabinose/galactoside ABC-type transport system permease subunit
VPTVAFGLVLLAYLLTPVYDGHELTTFDAFNTLQGFASVGLIALALGLTIIAGEFDLSVLGMQALGGVLAVKAGVDHGLVGVLAAVGACAALGAVQGAVIARSGVGSMSITLGSYIALLGLTNVLAGSETLTYPNTDVSIWVNESILPWFSPRSLVTLGAFAVALALFSRTRLGPELKSLGGDRRASRVVGVPVGRHLTALFAVSAGLCGCAGALLAYSNASAQLNPGLEPLVLAASAAVLGGVSLRGGRGAVWGLLLGALAVALLQQVFAITKLPTSSTQIVFGALLLIVVVVDAPDLRSVLARARARRASGRPDAAPHAQPEP